MFGQKEYIYCVYRERSFSKAADKLFISQSSLSATIKKVENDIGAPIFDRRKYPISLTPFGLEYIHALEQIFNIEERLKHFIYNVQTLERGSLAVGGSNLGIAYRVPRVIAAFKTAHPNIHLHIVGMNTIQIMHMMDSGELDLIITNRPLDTGKYERAFCWNEQLILAVPRAFAINSALTAKQIAIDELMNGIFEVPEEKTVALSDFVDTPFILLPNGNYLRQCTDALFQESGVIPQIVLELEPSAAAFNFAGMGLGATIISNLLIEDSPKNDCLVFYKIRSDLVTRPTFIGYRRGIYLTYAMQNFIEMMMGEGKGDNN
jgi:DNA-binding transcriptional LysR family regulator